ncbi:unnamed protein product [Dicrocoelium dendriticum]|nr:unnamed protein product [Dicrocoelium dendriticum]
MVGNLGANKPVVLLAYLFPVFFHSLLNVLHATPTSLLPNTVAFYYFLPCPNSRSVLYPHRSVSLLLSEKFGVPREGGEPGERCIPATYRLLYFIGWKPDPSQRKPLPRGSAQFSLKDISRIDEIISQVEESAPSSDSPTRPN